MPVLSTPAIRAENVSLGSLMTETSKPVTAREIGLPDTPFVDVAPMVLAGWWR